MADVRDTTLYKKVYGCLIGGAIGDALGGPVEGREWTPEKLRETYGEIDRLMPYERPIGYHAHFHKAAGAYTDDTRMKHLSVRGDHRGRGHAPPGRSGSCVGARLSSCAGRNA